MIKRKFAFAHMRVASEYAKLSSCERLKVGAVIVKGDTPIAIGYNGTKAGQSNCCEGSDGKTLPTVRHAEINALNKLWGTNESSQGSVIFITHAPCYECAQDVANAGISEVYFRWAYRDDDGIAFLLNKGVAVYKVLPDLEIVHRASLRYDMSFSQMIEEVAYDKISEDKEINEVAASIERLVGESQEVAPELAPVVGEMEANYLGWNEETWNAIWNSGFIPFDTISETSKDQRTVYQAGAGPR